MPHGLTASDGACCFGGSQRWLLLVHRRPQRTCEPLGARFHVHVPVRRRGTGSSTRTLSASSTLSSNTPGTIVTARGRPLLAYMAKRMASACLTNKARQRPRGSCTTQRRRRFFPRKNVGSLTDLPDSD